MRDYYFKPVEGKLPSMMDHLNALDYYVKGPLALALDTLTETIEPSGEGGEAINQSLAVIHAALVTWGKIDREMMDHQDRVRGEV